MKKKLCRFAFLALSISVCEKAFSSSDLMKEAFPTPGFTKCYSNRAGINWNAVQRIEQAQGQAGINLVSTYIMQNIQPCLNSSNPNFVKKFKETCKGSQAVAQNQQWLCQSQGINLSFGTANAAQAQNNSTLAVSSNQANQLVQQAIPQSSQIWDRCAVETGRVNWSMVKQLVDNGYGNLANNRLDQITKPCILAKNKNMLNQLANTCNIAVNSQEQYTICTQVAQITGQPNAASQQIPKATQSQTVSQQQPVMGQVLGQQNATTQTQMTQNAATQTMPEQPQVNIPEAPTCPNLDAEKANLAKQKADLEAYKKSLEAFRDQLTQIREQLVAYQQQLQSSSG